MTGSTEIREMMGTLLADSSELGVFTLPELILFARAKNVNGVAVSPGKGKDLYLAFIGGEPEGAIYVDEKGELFGDKAVMLITGEEQFTLHEVQKELIGAMVMGCRIFNKSHLRADTGDKIPEFGTRSSGIGKLTLVIRHGPEPRNGIRVSLRNDGQIVGSDITTEDGRVGFRVMHGRYECVLQDRNQVITTRHITFDAGNSEIVLIL